MTARGPLLGCLLALPRYRFLPFLPPEKLVVNIDLPHKGHLEVLFVGTDIRRGQQIDVPAGELDEVAVLAESRTLSGSVIQPVSILKSYAGREGPEDSWAERDRVGKGARAARKKPAEETSMVFKESIFPPSTYEGQYRRVHSPDAGSIAIERNGCQPDGFSRRHLDKKKDVDNNVENQLLDYRGRE
jgi:hypothetical protein